VSKRIKVQKCIISAKVHYKRQSAL